MLYMLMLYHSFSNSNTITLIILCIIALIVECFLNLKLNLMWCTIFTNKTMILTSSGAGFQSNQSISRHRFLSPSSRRNASHDHLQKWRRCSWLMTPSKYEFHNQLFEYSSPRTVYMEAAAHIQVFLFLNSRSCIAIAYIGFSATTVQRAAKPLHFINDFLRHIPVFSKWL